MNFRLGEVSVLIRLGKSLDYIELVHKGYKGYKLHSQPLPVLYLNERYEDGDDAESPQIRFKAHFEENWSLSRKGKKTQKSRA